MKDEEEGEVMTGMLTKRAIHSLTPKPPLGWNSYDCYGCSATEEDLLGNLEVMAQRLKPYGYEYFVLDNGWFGEYNIAPGKKYPNEKHAHDVRLDEYGRLLPSKCCFPNGLQPIIDRTHELGLKFGIHIMRGISRKAVDLNLPILGSEFRAADIANKNDTCRWCHYNYGVNMDHPGAQLFYNSWVSLLASWGVDYIKADDITGFPREIEALAKAIENSGRDIALSLSPGGQTTRERMPVYSQANMIRTTQDIWDNRGDLNKAFDAWLKYNDIRIPGFWLDMDMIPFGHLMVWNPEENRASQPIDNNMELSGKGFERMSGLSRDQKYTFITMRALAASPLFMGGELRTSDEFSFKLITNEEMLACNQNAVMGKQIYKQDGIEIWSVASASKEGEGWIGIFNRNEEPKTVNLSISGQLGLYNAAEAELTNIWEEPEMSQSSDGYIQSEIGGDGVLFLKYKEVRSS